MTGRDSNSTCSRTRSETCPHPDCSYTSTEQGVKIHYGKTHDGTISGSVVECDFCSDKIRKNKCRIERSENDFCSEDCKYEYFAENYEEDDWATWEGGRDVVECVNCGKQIQRKPSQTRNYDNHICSNECRGEWLSEHLSGDNSAWEGITGPDHPLWEGGPDDVYRTGDWRHVRESILNRDDGICQRCYSEATQLEVHHITPLSNGGAKFDKENLITLCQKCHNTVHSNPEGSQHINIK